VKLLYFAWVRERIGRPDEEIDPPANVATAGELIDWLRSRGPEYEDAFAESKAIRIALDKVHASRGAPIAGVREMALFPPMTGG
jgi:molybdopterin synthase sulfur carrier subunit